MRWVGRSKRKRNTGTLARLQSRGLLSADEVGQECPTYKGSTGTPARN